MSDPGLLVFGCGISFIVAAGAYVFVRERFLASHRSEPVRVRADRRPIRRAASPS